MPANTQTKKRRARHRAPPCPFDVLVDDQPVQAVDRHETIEVPIEPGHHTLLIRSGRYSSRQHTLEATDDVVVDFRCHGAMVWPR